VHELSQYFPGTKFANHVRQPRSPTSFANLVRHQLVPKVARRLVRHLAGRLLPVPEWHTHPPARGGFPRRSRRPDGSARLPPAPTGSRTSGHAVLEVETRRGGAIGPPRPSECDARLFKLHSPPAQPGAAHISRPPAEARVLPPAAPPLTGPGSRLRARGDSVAAAGLPEAPGLALEEGHRGRLGRVVRASRTAALDTRTRPPRIGGGAPARPRTHARRWAGRGLGEGSTRAGGGLRRRAVEAGCGGGWTRADGAAAAGGDGGGARARFLELRRARARLGADCRCRRPESSVSALLRRLRAQSPGRGLGGGGRGRARRKPREAKWRPASGWGWLRRGANSARRGVGGVGVTRRDEGRRGGTRGRAGGGRRRRN
jgi:hypothetical protein